MSDHSPSPSRPAAVAAPASPAGRSSLLEQVIASTAAGGFDADAFHALERRDEAGDADEREPLVAAALESAQTHGFAGLERRSGWLGPVARG